MSSISQKNSIEKALKKSFYNSYSQKLSEQVRRGIEAKREKIIEITVKRGQVEDVLRNVTREIKELEKTKGNLQRLLKN